MIWQFWHSTFAFFTFWHWGLTSTFWHWCFIYMIRVFGYVNRTYPTGFFFISTLHNLYLIKVRHIRHWKCTKILQSTPSIGDTRLVRLFYHHFGIPLFLWDIFMKMNLGVYARSVSISSHHAVSISSCMITK